MSNFSGLNSAESLQSTVQSTVQSAVQSTIHSPGFVSNPDRPGNNEMVLKNVVLFWRHFSPPTFDLLSPPLLCGLANANVSTGRKYVWQGGTVPGTIYFTLSYNCPEIAGKL